jgi:hypothetical protein
MSQPFPTEEEFNAWLQHPVTQRVIRALEGRRETLRRLWEGGSFTDYAQEGTVLTNVANLGTCRGYAYLCDLDYETFSMEIEDGESKRVEAPRGSGAGGTV